MGKLIYSMITSVDGHVSDADGSIGFGPPDEATHTFINEQSAKVGTYLYGSRMFDIMTYWETPPPASEPYELEYARIWQAAEKVVYSTKLAEVKTARTRIERSFDPAQVRRLKEESALDLTVTGPNLAAQAIRAGLVDEYELYVDPTLTGGGTRFFPDGVPLKLDLLDERRLGNGVMFLRYAAQDR